jgi:hypothetical protein
MIECLPCVCTVGFGFGNFLNVEAPFFAVDGNDLAFLLLVSSSHNDDLIVFADRHAPDPVLFSEILGKRSAHQGVSHVRRSLEVGSSLDSPGA